MHLIQQLPIALKSNTCHASESFWGFPLEIAPQQTTEIQTPESVNLDFHTGLPAQKFSVWIIAMGQLARF